MITSWAASWVEMFGLTVPDGDEYLTIGGNWLKFFHGRGGLQGGCCSVTRFHRIRKDKLVGFFGGEKDLLDGLSLTEKWDYVNNTSYNQFLVDRVGLIPSTRYPY